VLAWWPPTSAGFYNRSETQRGVVHVVVSEGMELIIVLLVILANLVGLVLLQKWTGLT